VIKDQVIETKKKKMRKINKIKIKRKSFRDNVEACKKRVLSHKVIQIEEKIKLKTYFYLNNLLVSSF